MYELKKNGKVFTSKSVETGPSSYEKRIYRAAVSQRLRNTAVDHIFTRPLSFCRTLREAHIFKQGKIQCGTEEEVFRAQVVFI